MRRPWIDTSLQRNQHPGTVKVNGFGSTHAKIQCGCTMAMLSWFSTLAAPRHARPSSKIRSIKVKRRLRFP
jgi:hypothetical protein